ncbi:MAG: citramalate synthase [Crocosphaera sp.]|nr:citramalate synthase [Crocosphaera sp.]
MASNQDKDDFFYPHYPYRGEVKPENVVFNANLQEFAQEVNYICNLETAGKIKPEQAYRKIKELWKKLKLSKQELKIGENFFNQEFDNNDEDDTDND